MSDEFSYQRVEQLLAKAKTLPPMTREQKRDQRLSFVYGNLHIDNPRITREMVEEQDRKLNPEDYPRIDELLDAGQIRAGLD